MIHEVNGNLLTYKNLPVICHQANCQNTMGAGIALYIKRQYPSAYEADTRAFERGQAVLGNISIGEERDVEGTITKRIINIYGQNLYGRESRKTNYEALYLGFEKVRKYLETNNIKEVGINDHLGCNLAGGNWRIVKTIIEEVFRTFDGDVYIVELVD